MIKKKHLKEKKNSLIEKNFFIDYIKKQEEKIKKSQKKQFFFFVLGFLIFYLILTAIAYAFPKGFFEAMSGQSVNAILNVIGYKTTTLGGEEFHIFLDIAKQGFACPANQQVCLDESEIIISWLCSGILEIIILVSAILASFGVSWRKKAIGVIVAITSGYLFNIIRIIITIIIILSQEQAVFELAHDLLFRATLFIYIVAIYVIWFYWANNGK